MGADKILRPVEQSWHVEARGQRVQWLQIRDRKQKQAKWGV